MPSNLDLKLESYNYNLPEEFIAQLPTLPEHGAKLLVCKKNGKKLDLENKKFIDLPDLLGENTVIFFNESKVFRGRIVFEGRKCVRKRGKILDIDGEIFVYKVHGENIFEALVSDDKNFKPGSQIFFENNIVLTVKNLTPDGVLFNIEGTDIFSFLEKSGQMPLPPYIKYEKSKEKRYQTNFAKELGSSAAPTASLHFTEKLLKKLEEKNIQTEFEVLHVGLGTFRPVYQENILEHKMHGEELFLDLEIFEKIMKYKLEGKKILAVGTTMTRFLESLPFVWRVVCNIGTAPLIKGEKIKEEVKEFRDKISENISLEEAEKIISFSDENNQKIQKLSTNNLKLSTKLFMYPGFEWKVVDQLVTNFHLPKSSLMMLVASKIGRENLLNAYEFAMENNYKFYSFGDGMVVL